MTYRDPRGRHCTICVLVESNSSIQRALSGPGSLAGKVRHIQEVYGHKLSYKAAWRHLYGQHVEARQLAKQKLAWTLKRAHLKRSMVFRVLRDYSLERILNDPSRISSTFGLRMMELERQEDRSMARLEAELEQN